MKKAIYVILPLFLLIGSLCSCTPNNNEDRTKATKPYISNENNLQENYDAAVMLFESEPAKHRDIGELQMETQEILLLDGKYYQSYIASNVDLRYVFISQSEYSMAAKWDWLPIGTANDYAIENLGKIDEGRK